MSLTRRLMPYLAGLLTSPGRVRWRRRVAEWRRRLGRRPHRAVFYFRVDDPYSWLMAQALPRFAQHFGLTVEPRVMLYLERTLYPAPDMLRELAPVDADRLARLHGLEFPDTSSDTSSSDTWRIPDHDSALAATRCLLLHEHDERFWSLAHALSDALWRDDQERLERLISEHGQQPEDQARLALEARRDQFLDDGHYLTATLHYGGEWYWSLDRLDHLAERLDTLGAGEPATPGARDALPIDCGRAKRPALTGTPATAETGNDDDGARPVLELFYSFRSPYSYIALGRTYALADHYGLALAIRPVLPMVMRGLSVPKTKRFYILADAAREARLHRVPFGRVCDPVGLGVERCMAIWPFAEKEGRLREWLLAAGEGIWSQGLDAATDAGLRRMVENAGMDWNRARRWLDDDQWRERGEANRQAMMDAGSWGVPTFRLGDQVFWGQDRFALIEQALPSS